MASCLNSCLRSSWHLRSELFSEGFEPGADKASIGADTQPFGAQIRACPRGARYSSSKHGRKNTEKIRPNAPERFSIRLEGSGALRLLVCTRAER